jgi:hypothetical protein
MICDLRSCKIQVNHIHYMVWNLIRLTELKTTLPPKTSRSHLINTKAFNLSFNLIASSFPESYWSMSDYNFLNKIYEVLYLLVLLIRSFLYFMEFIGIS